MIAKLSKKINIVYQNKTMSRRLKKAYSSGMHGYEKFCFRKELVNIIEERKKND